MQLRNAKRMQINLEKGKSYFISCLWSFVFMVQWSMNSSLSNKRVSYLKIVANKMSIKEGKFHYFLFKFEFCTELIQNLILIQNLDFCFRKLVLENMGNNLRKSKCFWHLLFLSKWCWFSSIDCSHTLDFTWDISTGNFMQVWFKYNGTLRWKSKYNCLFRCSAGD